MSIQKPENIQNSSEKRKKQQSTENQKILYTEI